MQIRLAADLQIDSIVDGKGIRTVIWTQGCGHHCPGCHNFETQSFTDGDLIDVEDIKAEIKELEGQDGVTFSGGDPFYQPEACAYLAKYIHSLGMNVWCYTGFTYEKLLELAKDKPIYKEFLSNIDVLIILSFPIHECFSFSGVFSFFQQERHTLHSVFLQYIVISITWYILHTRDVLVIIHAICSISSLEGGDRK